MRGKPSPEPTSFWPGGSPAQTSPHPPGPGLGLGVAPVRPQAPMPQGSAQGSAPSPATWAQPAPSSSQTPPSGTLFPIYPTQGRGCVLPSCSLPPSLLQNLVWSGAALLFWLPVSILFLSLAFWGPGCPGTQLIFITPVCGSCCFTSGETEAQTGSVTCPRQHSTLRGSQQGRPWRWPPSGWPQEEQPGPGATGRERLAVPAPPPHAPSRHTPECSCQRSLSSQPHSCPWASGTRVRKKGVGRRETAGGAWGGEALLLGGL